MNPNFSDQDSPLSRFLEDDTLTIMERVIPHCRPPLAKFLAICMKTLELQKIMTDFEDTSLLRACGFENTPADMEAVLRSLRGSVSEEKAQQIDSILNFMRFSRLYQNWQETMRSHPELMQLLNQSFSPGSNSSGESSADEKETSQGNLLTDPSLFMMLSSAMKNTGGASDISNVLSALMKKNSS